MAKWTRSLFNEFTIMGKSVLNSEFRVSMNLQRWKKMHNAL